MILHWVAWLPCEYIRIFARPYEHIRNIHSYTSIWMPHCDLNFTGWPGLPAEGRVLHNSRGQTSMISWSQNSQTSMDVNVSWRKLHWVGWLACLAACRRGVLHNSRGQTWLRNRESLGGAETLKLSDFAYLSFPLINAMKQLGFQSLEYHEKLLNNKAVKYSTRKQEAVFGVGSVHCTHVRVSDYWCLSNWSFKFLDCVSDVS